MERDGLSPEHQLLSSMTQQEAHLWIQRHAMPYKELMAYYRCAAMEVETKFNVLNEQLSLQYDRNPIETIKTRIKSPDSIADKLMRKGLPVTLESIENNIYDIAGIRVICSFPSDIYTLAEAFLKQDDVRLVEAKDYIAHPKENGYRSLHLIIEIPIYLQNQKRLMKVEVQFRTISMDWWASLEHKIRYKKDIPIPPQIAEGLYACAEVSAQLDRRMELIYQVVANETGQNEGVPNCHEEEENS